MIARSHWVARLVLVAFVAAGLVGSLGAAPASAANRDERQLRGMVNEARDQSRVRNLNMRRFLVHAARRHSRQMAATARLEHSDNLASLPGGRPWTILGENIGVGASMEVLHDAFMDSPAHRRNELNRVYRSVGVGMARGTDGRIWVTVLFLG
jgi:uncharacterized protein YkwD